jgi:PAS domain S-box-containing protein
MITAHATLESAVSALNDGASAFITKPLDMDDVLAKITTIFERQRLIEEKRRVEEELNQLFNISIPLCVIDRNFNILLTNNTFNSKFKVHNSKIMGKKCYTVLSGNLCNTSKCTLRQIIEGATRCEEEREVKLSDGSKITCLVRGVPYLREKEEVIGVIGNFTDITDRKRAENDLRKSEIKLRSLFEKTPISIWEEDFSEVKKLINNLKKKVSKILKNSSPNSEEWD